MELESLEASLEKGRYNISTGRRIEQSFFHILNSHNVSRSTRRRSVRDYYYKEKPIYRKDYFRFLIICHPG